MNRGPVLRVWLPLLLASVALGFAFALLPGPRDILRWAGLVLAIAGLSGVIVARYTLGRSFSILPKATALVTRGIYAHIRNPIYVFGMVFTVGLLLMLRKSYLWFVLPIFAGLQIVRARKEARVLEARFGDAYREYRARTWF